jgi:four helix bundle protein
MKEPDPDSQEPIDNEEETQEFANKLEERLIDFAVRIIKLASALPNTPAGRHIAGQILRSGTSPAPNYGEARGAESKADFVHKIRVVLKELNETRIWLVTIERSKLLAAALLTDIIGENSELCKIFGTSLKTIRVGKRKLRINKSQLIIDQ